MPAPAGEGRRRAALECARPPWNSAEIRPELNKSRPATLGLPHEFVALVRPWDGSTKGKVPKRREPLDAAVFMRRDATFVVRGQSLFRTYFSTATRGSVGRRKCKVFRRKTGSFLASGRTPRNPRAADWPERVAVPGGARFQGEDVQNARIPGRGHEKKETKRRPVNVSAMKKSEKRTLFRVID